MRNAPVSAAQVYSGQSGSQSDGRGSAIILDENPDFLPYAQNLINMQRQEQLARQKQERANAEKLQGILKGPDLGKVPLRWQQQSLEDLNGYKQLAIDMGSGKILGEGGKRLDPLNTYDVEAHKLLSDREFEITNRAEAARNIDKMALEIVQAGKDPKYSKGKIANWLERYKNAKTIEDAIELQYENPLTPVVTMSDLVKNAAIDYAKDSMERGRTTTAREFISDERKKYYAEQTLLTPEGEQLYQEGLSEGKWKDEEGFYKEFSKAVGFDKPDNIKVSQDEGRSSGNGSGSGSGGSDAGEMFIPVYDDSGRVTSIEMNYDTQKAKTLTLIDEKRTPRTVTSTPSLDLVDDPNDLHYGEWRVLAEVEETVEIPYTEEQIEENESLKAAGQPPIPKKKEKIVKIESFPLDNKQGKQGNDNYRKLANLAGGDEKFQLLFAPNGGGQPQMSQDQWNAAWAKLKPGETMVGLDGKTYKKK